MKIFILDDEEVLANTIAFALENHGYQVKVFCSYENFLKSIQEPCDLYIFDISIWDTSWFDVIREIKANNIQTPIIIISWHYSLNYKLEGLNIWADDYLVKPFHPDELIARVKTILRRRHPEIENTLLLYKDISFDYEKRILLQSNKEVILTKKEKQIIEFFLLRQNQLISKKTLIETIWADDSIETVTDNTINVTIYNIRTKLGKDFELETKIGEWYMLKS